MSISHFSSLSAKRRGLFLNNSSIFTYTEKVDGSNFTFGKTAGKFWSGRKNSEKYYHISDWPDGFWTSHFKHAHQAAEQWVISSGINKDFEVTCELLSTYWPNTIKYDILEQSDYLSSGIMVIYESDIDIDMTGLWTSHISDLPHTSDGRTITKRDQKTIWRFDTNKIENPLLNVDLSNANLIDQEEYLISLVRNMPSKFGASMIEGIVAKHPDGWCLKIVDKMTFTAQNMNTYRVRKLLHKTPRLQSQSVMDEFCLKVQNGMIESEARTDGNKHLVILYDRYSKNPDVDINIHRRNLEAFASLFQQFGD